MISNPLLLSATLCGLVFLVLHLSKQPGLSRVFHFLPAPFWCYFTPVILATFGLLPDRSPVYDFITTYVLSAALLLLLLGVQLQSIVRLGPTALGATAAGTLGIALGAVISYLIFNRWLPEDSWKGLGALSASWTGGNINMVAVKEALQTPESIFAPMVIVDSVITYAWMGLLIALSPWQAAWDRWVGADTSRLEDVNRRMGGIETKELAGKNAPLRHGVWLVAIGLTVGWAALVAAKAIAVSAPFLSTSGWAFILVTLLGTALSLTPVSRLERFGASRWGYFCLYLLLASIGAKARLTDILQAPFLIVLALLWVTIHALTLAVYGRLFRVPMFFLVTGSQANIGGTASAPVIAGVYQPKLASLGLLLAVACNLVGTYVGLLIAMACQWVSVYRP